MMKKTISTMLSACLLLALTTSVPAQARFTTELVAENLGVPWGMVFLSPQQLLITERHGNVRLLDPDSGQISHIGGAPQVFASGQGGLLDVAIPTDFQPGGWIYFTYSKNLRGQGATTLARAKLAGEQLVSWQELLVTRSTTDTGRHFGSRITFDDRGHLFFGIGDRGVRPGAQDLSNHTGSVIRLRLDGSVPADNPFVDQPGAQPEIWSYGHRNPQGLSFDRATQRLWSVEHGPRGGDEINLIEAAENYGWPVVSFGKEYWGPLQVGEGTEKEGMQPPVKVYIPSIAPGSLLVYSGRAFPEWRGNLLIGALKLTHLNRVELNAEGEAVAEERLLGDLGERIRALAEDSRGWLYFSTDSGKIFRLRP